MSSAGRIRRRSLRLICSIDMTAFLSVQVALLFMFIAAAGNRPDLPTNTTTNPKVEHPIPMRGANREDALIVAVRRDGRVYLGYERTSPDELPLRIRDAVSHGAERKVYMNVDARAHYRQVREVLAAVQSSGVEQVGFLVWERNSAQSAP